MEHYPDTHHDNYSKTVFGFWVYLLTDFMLFATLFSTYAVLRGSTFGGPSASMLLDPYYALIASFFLLAAAFMSGISGIFAHRKNKKGVLVFSFLTFICGFCFFSMQLGEFLKLLRQGHSWVNSAFLSAYFTLTGTFFIHIAIGLLWLLVFVIPLCFHPLTWTDIRRITCLRMFWQFLNVVWIFIFATVYLMR